MASLPHQQLVRQVRQGNVVVLPTETAYALAVDATNARAVALLKRVKGRDRKPIALMAADLAQVERFFALTPTERTLAQRYWPGPCTLVLTPRPGKVAGRALSRTGRIGIRVPALAAARAFVRAVGRPVTATSANRSGAPTCYTVAAVMRSLGRQLPARDIGPLPRRRPSTVAEVVKGNVLIHRRGSVRIPQARYADE